MSRKSLPARIWRAGIIALVGTYLLLPLFAMLNFSTQPFGGGNQGRTLRAWRVIPTQQDLVPSVILSLTLALIVMIFILIIVVPTVVWVHLKLPKLRRTLELICLLPLATPAIVIVVGVAPIYRWMSIHVTESGITLAGVYTILILPYTYRSLSSALAAVDIHTLAEAARTLGASTARMMGQVIIPTIRSGIISGAVVSIALVLGEFTISSLLNFKTLQPVVANLGRSDGYVAVAVSLASLLFVFALLAIIPTEKKYKLVLDVDIQ